MQILQILFIYFAKCKFLNPQMATNSTAHGGNFQYKRPVDHVCCSLAHFMITAAHNCQWNVGHVVIID